MGREKEIVHIVFICDENYVMPTIVAITSILKNRRDDTEYSIHILASSISVESAGRFKGLASSQFQIEVLELQQSEEFKRYAIKNLHVTTAALYKFNIPKLFPNLKKILYLDGDILVQRDLTELYQTNISDVYGAVVKDYKPMTYKPPQVVKLGVDHKCYFNSGVMLLNLDKLREDQIPEKLLDYRLNGVNYFMDQDALNVVFREKVVYLSLEHNVMSSVMGFFSLQDLVDYYGLTDVKSKSEIYDRAVIVHLCTKYKPWEYDNVPFADKWLNYYNESTFEGPLQRKKLSGDIQKKIFAELDWKSDIKKMSIPYRVIISLTSFPDRINTLFQVIQSLLNQTVKADKIILWLANSQFPMKEENLPENLLNLRSDVFCICWCDDIKPHKKYFYTMKEHPDSIVITVDDDLCYREDLVEILLQSYLKFPFAVSAMRAHLMTFDSNGEINSYAKWKREYRNVGVPSMALCATGVGGVLYPPRVMHKELFNKEIIFKTCLTTDDLWLKIMQVMNHTPVVVAAQPQKIRPIEDSQQVALWKQNDTGGRNDMCLRGILKEYNTFFGGIDTLSIRMRVAAEQAVKVADKQAVKVADKQAVKVAENQAVLAELKRELAMVKREILNIRSSWTYRIGRFITFIPRKVRGGVRCYREHGWHYTFERVLVHLHLKKDPYRR